jgi:HEAT repeat protein
MWLLLVAAVHAGVAEDVRTASDTDLPTELRQSAFDRIAQPGGVPALMKLADDPQTPGNQRWVAIRALGPIRDDDARIGLLHYLASKDASARIAALGALGDRGDQSLSDHVAARLEDPALLVRAAAGQALGKLKDPRSLGDLDRALHDPSNQYRGTSLWFRRIFVESIVAIGTDAAPPYLAGALDDADPTVSAAALAGLEKIAGFSYKEGRTPDQEREAWRRWARHQ